MAESPTQNVPAATNLPNGVSKPVAAMNRMDQSGVIAILTGFAVGLVLLSAGVRVYARRAWRTYRIDDFAFFLASILGIVQVNLVFVGLAKGLGKDERQIRPHDVGDIQKLSFAASLLYLLILFFSKVSTSFLFLHLTPSRPHIVVIQVTLMIEVVWMVCSVVLDSLRCHPDHPWKDDMNNCTNAFARWAFISGFDVLIELALVATSVYIVWNLKMRARGKMIVVGAFSCRLPNIGLTIARLVFIHQGFTEATSHIWVSRVVSATELGIGYTITASIIPYLKPFMMAYERPEASRASHYPSAHSGGSKFKLSALTSRSTGTGVTTPTTRDDLEGSYSEQTDVHSGLGFGKRRFTLGRLRPGHNVRYEARADVGCAEREDHENNNSQVLIIKKGMEWSVEYDRRGTSLSEGGRSETETENGNVPVGEDEIFQVSQHM